MSREDIKGAHEFYEVLGEAKEKVGKNNLTYIWRKNGFVFQDFKTVDSDLRNRIWGPCRNFVEDVIENFPKKTQCDIYWDGDRNRMMSYLNQTSFLEITTGFFDHGTLLSFVDKYERRMDVSDSMVSDYGKCYLARLKGFLYGELFALWNTRSSVWKQMDDSMRPYGFVLKEGDSGKDGMDLKWESRAWEIR